MVCHRVWPYSGMWSRTLVTGGPLTLECLMETHFSQSLVRMAVLSPPVFQHVPHLRVRLDGRSVDVHPVPGPLECRLPFFMTGFAPLTSCERHEPWTAFVRAVLTIVVTSDERDFNHCLTPVLTYAQCNLVTLGRRLPLQPSAVGNKSLMWPYHITRTPGCSTPLCSVPLTLHPG